MKMTGYLPNKLTESMLSIKTHCAQGCDYKYDFEWPKTHADITWLLGLKSHNLQKITVYRSKNCLSNIEGILIQFEGERKTIGYGITTSSNNQ